MMRPTQLACLLTMPFAACHTTPPRRALGDADYPGVLRTPSALPRDVVWQQRVTATWGDQAGRGFDAAVQKRGDTMTVMGLSPAGSLGFAAILSGTAIELQNPSGQELPFPARFILLDVQRAFYPWIPAITDGDTEAVVDGELVHETWREGRLRERSFRRIDNQPAGIIVVRYEWAHADWFGPSHVELDNAWFGYRLSVETQGETLLAGNGESG